jgi:hypothetical protein
MTKELTMLRWWCLALLAACNGPDTSTDDTDEDTETPATTWECVLEAGSSPPYAEQIGCEADWDVVAANPFDGSIPGAHSGKTVIDRSDGNRLYFQNSNQYGIHWEFASANLSGQGKPVVPDLGTFNLTEYYSPDRRFILGAVTYYAEPDVWAYEIAPYDSADFEMMTTAYRAIRDNAFFGDRLRFHPTSVPVALEAQKLPDDIQIITTEELYDGITYQPLNLGTSYGLLAFYTAEEVANFANFRELVVLDEIPNDISVVAGVITDAFQTPLSHINVLSQNRGTPNMALTGAFNNPELRALEGKWIELVVGPFEWTVREVDQATADAWWEDHRPEPLDLGEPDLSVTAFTDVEDILDLENLDLGEALQQAIPAFGGKASHYGKLAQIGPDVPVPDAFAIPLYWYDLHMTNNGLWDHVHAMLADPEFQGSPQVRIQRLTELQTLIMEAPIDPVFMDLLNAKLEADYDGHRMRFRSSTNAEDLGSFTGAGLYTSQSGEPGSLDAPVEDAVRTVWASVWGPRAYEERSYYGIDHLRVGMALLSHRSFPREEANGVAISANIFDTTGLEPAFYVNVQLGGESVVKPEPGVFTDQYLHYYDLPGQPVTYIAHSNLVPQGQTVLNEVQINQLGRALAAIHAAFLPVYGVSGGFYGMDTEFKFDGEIGETPTLQMKQARPYPGRNAAP